MEKKFKLIKQFPGCKFDTGSIFGHDFLSQMQKNGLTKINLFLVRNRFWRL